MPTENRSSNTEQMVSVPRSLLEEACNGLRITQDRARKELRALLAQPAAQHQGEPVALPARKDPTQHWAEPGGVHKAEGWNAYHDELARLGPLYTNPDAGELERLRADVETMRRKNNEYWHESEALRAQLAGHDALLNRWLDVPRHLGNEMAKLANDTEAALSASAEPKVKL
ncbi:hypothetical protein [Pseudomonas sp. MF6396]|uniref:hypothetical protein n=1 Tax=Pseudomonas sp. MF6396 TaxID=1960828 RepID=UPI001290625E|nr:hypothetical protein [Pseudomonas sp. MF6396]